MDGTRITAARKALGMSQQDLANALGTSQAAIHRYETGDRDPKSGTVVKLASVLGVTVSYLLGVSEDMRNVETDPDPRLNEIVDAYRNVTEEGRRLLLVTARGVAQTYRKTVPEVRVAESA